MKFEKHNLPIIGCGGWTMLKSMILIGLVLCGQTPHVTNICQLIMNTEYHSQKLSFDEITNSKSILKSICELFYRIRKTMCI
jgi:hypothetical protein